MNEKEQNMKKIFTLIAISLFLSTTIFALVIKNQTKKTIVIVLNYTNENFYRVYEQLSPSLFNSEPTLKLSFSNLTEIQVYDKIPTRYKNGNKIILKKEKNKNIASFKDLNNNNYKKMVKSDKQLLPDGLLEISEDELKDQKYGILVDSKGGFTFVVSTAENVLTK